MKRNWRKPTEEDKQRKCYARNKFEDKPFYVEWNDQYGVWASYGRSHILVTVSEILEPKVVDTPPKPK